MTEQKPTTRKTPTSRANKNNPKTTIEKVVEAENIEPIVDDVVEVKLVEKQPLSDTDKVTVMNNCMGRYGYRGNSGYAFQLEEYGDTANIPFGELRAMSASKHKTHITNAYIVILNEDAVEELNYTKLYENILDSNGVEKILSHPDKIKETLVKMPKNMRETVVSIAKKKLQNGELTDLRVVNAIKESVNVDIME